MSVENNYITVAYKMYVTDAGSNEEEALVEECTSEHPFQFISNLGVALKSFEDKVANLKKGESFDFVIPAADAYGDFQEELMFDVDKKVFEINGRFDKEHIFEGNIIPLAGPEGERFNGTVIEIKDNAVTIDLNHPRAGQDLHFVGTVVENREATNEEVTGMLNMLSGEGCGCGCGCGGDCGGGCDSGDGCGCGHCH
ncbi:MAG: FKBP-type peptidyl-prolyl cis-trans isomerase [Bacteroidaceae bacterium]|nr:FKBP-type peptidyl-prolyl cis-trans isomerase [Bacteroidaceae bacterium]